MSIITRFTDSVKSVLGVQPTQKDFGGLTPDADYLLNEILAKSSRHIVPSFYDEDSEPDVKNHRSKPAGYPYNIKLLQYSWYIP